MTPEEAGRNASVPRSASDRIDDICRPFSNAWKAGTAPCLEDYLGDTVGPERDALFVELLRLELEYRTDRGDRPDRGDYVARFPAQADLVRREFDRCEAGRDRHPRQAPESTSAYQPPPAPLRGERFPPGTLLAGRYRIVSALGRGGMGEVYRADDLHLEQTVALKFLPAHLADDPDRLARLRKEVAAARRVRNRYCCGVHDVGEHRGQTFLTMDYIDGEDLASLLRRSGRQTEEKATQLARELCEAVGAVHDQGLLHRDLKPANVMVDGRGHVRLVDFGLTTAEEGLTGTEVRAGTPGYQAPEQLRGESVDRRSDLFALGLVLYELFTGKRAFPAGDRQELVKRYDSGPPSRPSNVVAGLSELVERVILRCLERDPTRRPKSAYEVLAALPGGDPLQDALQKGETPSPDAVRDAGGDARLSPLWGGLCLGATVAGLALALTLQPAKLISRVPLAKPPDVLIDRARGILDQVGEVRFKDSAHGFDHDTLYLRWVEENKDSPRRWDALRESRPAALYFWYRQGPSPLVPALYSPYPGALAPGRITWHDPPPLRPGMAAVKLDLQGNLLEYLAIPTEEGEVPLSDPKEPDWGPLFEAAKLDFVAFQKMTSTRLIPPVYAHRRTAWSGVLPGRPDIKPVTVEAAAYLGRPVSFRVVMPWTRQDDSDAPQSVQGSAWYAPSTGRSVVFVLLLGASAVLAPVNLRRGRADRAGAFRLGLFVFVLFLAVWAFSTRHVAGAAELSLLILGLACALYWGALCWLGYVALEPFARRLWPETLISWSRLLAGRFRDPRVGRDLLAGVLAGLGWFCLHALARLMPEWMGKQGPAPYWDAWISSTFVSGFWMSNFLDNFAYSIREGLFFWLLFLILFRAVFRRPWLSAGMYTVAFIIMTGTAEWLPPLSWLFVGCAIAVGIGVLVQFGVLSVMTMYLVNLNLEFPITTDFSAWYARDGLWALGFVLALAGYGFWTSLDRRAFGEA